MKKCLYEGHLQLQKKQSLHLSPTPPTTPIRKLFQMNVLCVAGATASRELIGIELRALLLG